MTAPHAQHAGAGPRLVRTAVFTAVCVVLAAIGHALASCATVPWWSLGIGFLAVFAAAAPLAGRRRTLPGIGVGLTAGQLALHTLFGLGQHGSAAAQAPAGSSDTSVAALAAQLVCGGNSVPLDPASARQIVEAAGLDPAALAARSLDEGQAVHAHLAHAAGPAPETGLFSPAMLIGHLLAALAAGWLLGRGDAALGRLVELSRLSTEATPVRALRTALALVRVLGTGLPGAPARDPRAPRTVAGPAPATGREALQHAVIRRGPPPALVLAA
ncbi:hypothetical protein OG264_20425 [Streptomyces xanthophaeus]|uniref:hypothetical protein n=1 Tax=Streptomyces xanthophaeus TaxID=67385 RepID=UPI00386FA748|nr:hypothetical protein OG264_20425 [Streptomyces xanthophaeus]WST61359.1 hypothetical protein OG605_18015 [Streptomyces xanthophaeus]